MSPWYMRLPPMPRRPCHVLRLCATCKKRLQLQWFRPLSPALTASAVLLRIGWREGCGPCGHTPLGAGLKEVSSV